MQHHTTYKENWLVAYDIQSNSQRAKLHQQLKRKAINYQKSFFEIIATEQEIKDIAEVITPLINEETDKLFIICTTKSLKSYQAGINRKINPHGLFIIH